MNLSPKAQKALLDFYKGIRTLERLRLEAKGDSDKLEDLSKVASHGLKVTGEALKEAKSDNPFSLVDTSPSGGYLH